MNIEIGTVITKTRDGKKEFGVVKSVHNERNGAICYSMGYSTMPVFDFEIASGQAEVDPPFITFEELEKLIEEPIEDIYEFKNSSFCEYRIYKVHKYDPLPTNYFCGGNVEYHLTVFTKYGNSVGRIFGMYISRSEDGKLHYAIPG